MRRAKERSRSKSSWKRFVGGISPIFRSVIRKLVKEPLKIFRH